jgi:flavoprotein
MNYIHECKKYERYKETRHSLVYTSDIQSKVRLYGMIQVDILEKPYQIYKTFNLKQQTVKSQ